MCVLINSMDIPKSCSDCPLNYDEMSCVVTGTRWWSDTMVLLDFDYTKERLCDCPLSKVSSAQPNSSPEIQEILNYIDTTLHPIVSPDNWNVYAELHDMVSKLPSAQPEIIRCKDCEYGEQDDIGRWSCSSLGCQIGSDDGSGYCADAERRTDE